MDPKTLEAINLVIKTLGEKADDAVKNYQSAHSSSSSREVQGFALGI